MRAVILAGGEGTRLRPYTFVVPKPLLPVGNKPVLRIIIEHLVSHGVDEVVLATGYQAELIQAYFQDGASLGVRIHYIREEEPLGTAGPLRLLGGILRPDEDFILMNGDILTRLDFTRMLGQHRVNAADVTLGVRRIEERSPFGVLHIEQGRIVAVEEKQVRVMHVNAGIYILNARIIPDIPPGFYTMPDVINARLAAGRVVDTYHIEEPWLALEQREQMEQANRAPEDWTPVPCA
jgi:NDP-mannose synthase